MASGDRNSRREEKGKGVALEDRKRGGTERGRKREREWEGWEVGGTLLKGT